MPVKSAGSQWLKGHYNLSGYTFTHCSYIGNNDSIELTSKGKTFDEAIKVVKLRADQRYSSTKKISSDLYIYRKPDN